MVIFSIFITVTVQTSLANERQNPNPISVLPEGFVSFFFIGAEIAQYSHDLLQCSYFRFHFVVIVWLEILTTGNEHIMSVERENTQNKITKSSSLCDICVTCRIYISKIKNPFQTSRRN